MTSCSLLFNFLILYYFLLIFSLAAFFHVTATTATRPKFLIPSAIFVSLRFLSFVMIMILRPCPRSMAHMNTDTHTNSRAHTHAHAHAHLLASFLPRYQTHSASRVSLQRENMIDSLENTRHRCKETNLCAPSHSFECTWLHSTQNSSLITGWKVQEEGSLAFTIDLLEIAEYR